MLMEGKTQLWFKFDPSNRFVKGVGFRSFLFSNRR